MIYRDVPIRSEIRKDGTTLWIGEWTRWYKISHHVRHESGTLAGLKRRIDYVISVGGGPKMVVDEIQAPIDSFRRATRG